MPESASTPADLLLRSLGPGTLWRRVVYLATVDSTNRVAREMIAQGEPPGLVVVASFQSAGRGRRGRFWSAPPDTSVLLSAVTPIPPSALPADVTMMAALAAADAIAQATGLPPELKWPNDVLVGDRKACGILVESVAGPHGTQAIIGIGINGNFRPQDIVGFPATATTLLAEAGQPVQIHDLTVGLLKKLDLWYGCLVRKPEKVFAAWRARLISIGRRLTVSEGDRTWEAIGTGVQRDGGLVVRDDGGSERTVYAADVSVRMGDGYTSS